MRIHFSTLAIAKVFEKPHDFLIIGAQKAGTTSLHNYLMPHPQILLPRHKELHFFDNENIWRGLSPKVSYHAYNYLAEKDPRRRDRIRHLSESGLAIKGETTPIYSYWTPCIERIKKYNPDIKLIFILRNPIERAISHYKMEYARGFDQLDLWSALTREEERLAAEPHLQHRVYSYVNRGYYSRQISRLRRNFPNNQILILLSDDLDKNRIKTLNRVCHFLGVESIYNEALIHKLIKHHQGSQSFIPSTRERDFLKEKFVEEILRLNDMIEPDISHWLK